MKRIFYLSLFLFLVSCKEQITFDKTDINIINSKNENIMLRVELAVSEEQQAHGFMFRKDIPDGTGMLFIFDKDKIARFWMKNTPTPLSIAYINQEGIICDIFDMQPFSENDVSSTRYVSYALEVPQGWFSKNNVKTGDKVVISEDTKRF